MDYYCELSREQLEAALNFIRHVQDEKAKGRDIDLGGLRRVVVRRHCVDKTNVQFDIEYDNQSKAA
ncbi:MAG: hypothetical protein GX141_04250 [Armatimonadetes bacterium]|nr:hypothetical protein [Armatimonadota bacterium]